MFTRKFLFHSAALFLFSLVSVTGVTLRAANSPVTIGQGVMLSVSVDGTAPFSYQWYKDGVSLTGATAATFQIASFQSGDAGSYSAVISNSLGATTSDSGTLTVGTSVTAPVFTAQPVSQTVSAGTSVTFTAVASGSPAPTYQWRKNGTNLAGATSASYAIASSAVGDAATYTVVATNSQGSATSTGAVLTVNTAPVITTQPVSQTVTAGTSVTFNATASGAPAPSYQWRKNGTNVSGATGASYTIASTVTGDAGTYTVVASNAAGSVSSAGAVLAVNAINTAPTITVITAQTTGLGTAIGPITFTVGDTQTAVASLIVTGLSSNGTLVPAGNIVLGGSGANRTLTLTPAAGQSGTSTITVTVNDGTLTTSTSFVLTVSALAPTTQTVSNTAAMTIPDSGPASVYPSAITISDLGGTISAVSLSLNNLNHTWASDVDMILVSPTGQKIMLMSKAGGGGGATTNATLTFSNTATALLPQSAGLVTGTYLPTSYGASTIVFPAPAPAAPYDTTFASLIGQSANGVWSLYVMDGWPNDLGSIASGWTLTVTTTGAAPVAPTMSDITNQSTTTGTATVAIPFIVGDADTALSSLTLNGASSNATLVPNGNIVFGGSGANRTVAVTPAAGQTGTSTITVAVSDGSLTATDTFVLTVSAPLTVPVFTTQPASLAVIVGSSAAFTALAGGNPAPTYQWRKNGVAISGATTAAYSIASISAVDASTYTVVATNSVGSATSTGAVLTVNSAPVITTQPVSQIVTAGTSVTFTAAASGSPAPTYQWRKNGTNLAGATSASYTSASTVAGDAGTYTVVATNSVGSATSTGAVLTVNPATSAPVITTQPATQTVTKSSAVTFKVVASSSAALTYQWKKNGSKINGATGSSYTIASVSSGSAGTFTVVVANSLGSVTSSGAILTVKTTTAPAVYRVDFNRDGKSDLLWQNGTTGECSVWLLSGTAVSSKVSLGTGMEGLKICGTGDFNNDGKTDILWQNGVTGACSVGLMNGTTITSMAALGTVSTDWQLCGAGDFNGDGKSDLVWQNRVTDECSVWLMSGTAVSSVVSLGQAPADLVITGTGDFNKDGQSDILWQNEVTGEYGVWLMAGSTVSSSVPLGTVSLDWQLSGAGDYNADLRSDLLWQNLLTGETSVWLMNGTTVSSKIPLGSVTLDWFLRN